MKTPKTAYLGNAAGQFTTTDEQRGYSETRRYLASYPDADLQREYLAESKYGFNAIFGHNSRAFRNLIADELLNRGITEIPNIFSPIIVKRWSY